MNRLAYVLLLGWIGNATAFSALAGNQAAVIRPHSRVVGIDLGGMSPEDAAKKLRIWWEDQKRRKLPVHVDAINLVLPRMTASELGVGLDDVATVAKLPVLSGTSDTVVDAPDQSFDAVYRLIQPTGESVATVLKKAVGKPRPARVLLLKGTIYREPEISTLDLVESQLPEAVASAIKGGDSIVHLPITQGAKVIADDKLAEITDVVASFSTRFPKRQYNRNSNIKLASSKLNGVVLLPGDTMSFNGTVGQRTEAKGFKLAGVYKNGKHDTGIGGGICQVSTTMYNACLFSNLKILRRSNHSMPVAYVPLGRDATVDYGNLDLVIQNDKPYPIAISSYFEPGLLTFRVLGKKEPGVTVKLEQVGGKSWDTGVEIVHDPKLPVGDREVIEKGSRGHSITTYRLVYKNGVLQERQLLNHSYYGGGEKIIAVGPTAPTTPIIPKTTAPISSASVVHP